MVRSQKTGVGVISPIPVFSRYFTYYAVFFVKPLSRYIANTVRTIPIGKERIIKEEFNTENNPKIM